MRRGVIKRREERRSRGRREGGGEGVEAAERKSGVGLRK